MIRRLGSATWIAIVVAIGVLVTPTARAQAPSFLKAWYGGPNESERIWAPMGVAVDQGGDVYVVSWPSVHKYTNDGVFITMWGDTRGTGPGEFLYPLGIAVDSYGDVYVSDHDAHRVQKFTSGGAFIREWGSQGAEPGQFYLPTHIAIGPQQRVYVVDTGNCRVQYFDRDGQYEGQWSTNGSWGGATCTWNEGGVWGIAVDAGGDVFVADAENARIVKFSADGEFISMFGGPGQGDGQFWGIYGLAIDRAGDVYACDDGNARIQKFAGGGAFLLAWGSQGSAEGQFDAPDAVAVDRDGNVFVADTYNNRIQKFGYAPTPAKRTTWGGLKKLYR